MRISTRQRILQIIQRRRTETVSGLAKELGLAPATVRRHLDILQRDGMVQFGEVRKRTGRPEHAFSLTDRGHESLPKAYHSLLSGLLQEFARLSVQEIEGKTGAQALEAALTRLGNAAGRTYIDPARDAGPDTRIASAVRALREMGFEPDVQAGEAATKISLANCPFRSVALSDDTVCAYDSALLETILGAPVRRERCISRGHDGCEYVTGAAVSNVTGPGEAGASLSASDVDAPAGPRLG